MSPLMCRWTLLRLRCSTRPNRQGQAAWFAVKASGLQAIFRLHAGEFMVYYPPDTMSGTADTKTIRSHSMQRILILFFSSALLGVLLAQPNLPLPIRPGLFGAVLMLSVAWWIRGRWLQAPDAPEAPERRALLSLAGTVIVLAHLLASLWQIGPAMQLHTSASHAMGIDNWTLFGASLLMGWMARAPGPSADERDRQIAASALRCCHYSLLLQMLVFVLWLAFGRSALLEQLSRAMLAQLLICFWIVSCVVHEITCLQAYARDRRREAGAQ